MDSLLRCANRHPEDSSCVLRFVCFTKGNILSVKSISFCLVDELFLHTPDFDTGLSLENIPRNFSVVMSCRRLVSNIVT